MSLDATTRQALRFAPIIGQMEMPNQQPNHCLNGGQIQPPAAVIPLPINIESLKQAVADVDVQSIIDAYPKLAEMYANSTRRNITIALKSRIDEIEGTVHRTDDWKEHVSRQITPVGGVWYFWKGKPCLAWEPAGYDAEGNWRDANLVALESTPETPTHEQPEPEEDLRS